MAQTPPAPQPWAAPAKTSVLSAEAEAALEAELAALDGPAPAQPINEGAAIRRAKINPSDDTLDKLIARANSDLANDEVKRRQSAVSHMKAAVAATNADRHLGQDDDKDRMINNFRKTLDAVAPTAPAAAGNRPSPLVLVSEQRVDASDTTEAPKRGDGHLKLAPMPATQMRVENIFRSGDDDDDDFSDHHSNIFTNAETFEDFVDRLGASEQIELMEAAAIFVAHVQKQPLFRRRQLIRLMSTLPDALPLTREGCMTIFNQLLGMGRFAEMEPGLFAVTDRSPLLAEVLREAV